MERETKLTPNYIKTFAKKFDLNIIFLLNLSNKGIGAVGSLPQCTNLLMLDLSYNNVLMLNGMDTCICLTHINVSYNKISQLNPLKNCKELNTIMAQGNRIKDFKTIESLDGLKKLSSLYLQEFNGEGANPVCEDYNYANNIFTSLPELTLLDGQCKNQERLTSPQVENWDDDVLNFISDDPWYSHEINRPFNSSSDMRREIEDVEKVEDSFKDLLDDCEKKLKQTKSIYNI